MRDLGGLIDDFCDEGVGAGIQLPDIMRQVRWRYLKRALALHGGVSAAARAIGIHRNTAHRLLEEMREAGRPNKQP